jgi:hypothetical protein
VVVKVKYTAIHATAVFAKVKVNIVLAPKLLLMLGGLRASSSRKNLRCAAETRTTERCERVPIEGIETAVDTKATLE